jgi:hypothetical protein
MTRIWRSIKPNRFPFQNGATYDPKLKIQIEPVACNLSDDPIWNFAPLTKDARKFIPYNVIKSVHIFNYNEDNPFALLLTVTPPRAWAFAIRSRLISRRPEHVILANDDRCILLTPERVWLHRASQILGVAGDILAGTMTLPKSSRRPIVGCRSDIEELGDLIR